MGEVIEFGYRSKVAKSWEALEPYRQLLAREDKLSLLERYSSCHRELREPTLNNWQMKLCIFNAVLPLAETKTLRLQVEDYINIAHMIIDNFITKGRWQ